MSIELQIKRKEISSRAVYMFRITRDGLQIYTADGVLKTTIRVNTDGFLGVGAKADCPYWVESVSSDEIIMWVAIPFEKQNIVLEPSNDRGNPYDVFLFFNDFNDENEVRPFGYCEYEKVISVDKGGQGLAVDMNYIYFGCHVDNKIYAYDYRGNLVRYCDAPEHPAGLDFRKKRGTLLASSGYTAPPVVWEIDPNTCNKIREWDFSNVGYKRGALVASIDEYHIVLFTSDENNNFTMHIVKINDDGTYNILKTWYSRTPLGLPQGLAYKDGIIYYLSDGTTYAGDTRHLWLIILNGSSEYVDVVGGFKIDITAGEHEGLAWRGDYWFFGDSDNNVFRITKFNYEAINLYGACSDKRYEINNSMLVLPKISCGGQDPSGLNEGIYIHAPVIDKELIEYRVKFVNESGRSNGGLHLSASDPPVISPEGSDGYIQIGIDDNLKMAIVNWKFNSNYVSILVENGSLTQEFIKMGVVKKGINYQLIINNENVGDCDIDGDPQQLIAIAVPRTGDEIQVDYIRAVEINDSYDFYKTRTPKAYIFDGKDISSFDVPPVVVEHSLIASRNSTVVLGGGLGQNDDVLDSVFVWGLTKYIVNIDNDAIVCVLADEPVYVIDDSGRVRLRITGTETVPVQKGWRLVSLKDFLVMLMRV